MKILSTIGRGIRGVGRGILAGLDTAAQNSLTGGGLLDTALGQDGQPFTPTQQQRGALRSQFLSNIGSALQQGRPIGEGIQQYQQNAINQIQASQQAAARQKSLGIQKQFQAEMAAAQTPEAQTSVLKNYFQILGPEATKQYADALKAMRPEVIKPEGQPFSARNQQGDIVLVQRFSDGSVKPVQDYSPAPTVNFEDFGGEKQAYDQFGRLVGTSRPKTMTPGEKAEDSRYNNPRPVVQNVTGKGVYTIDTTTGKGTPVVDGNGQHIVGQHAPAQAPPGQGFREVAELRREFNQAVQPFSTVAEAYSKIRQAATNPTAAGDVSLLYGYMKLLDPNSVVRENEYATAANAGSIPERVWAQFNRARNGERLTDAMRADFVNQARKIIDVVRPQINAHIQRYSGIAQAYGHDPSRVVYDPFAFQQVQQQVKTPLMDLWRQSQGRGGR